MTNLPLDRLTEDLARVAFAGAAGDSSRLQRIGAEVELIPIEALTGHRCFIEDQEETATLPLLRRFGGSVGWREGGETEREQFDFAHSIGRNVSGCADGEGTRQVFSRESIFRRAADVAARRGDNHGGTRSAEFRAIAPARCGARGK